VPHCYEHESSELETENQALDAPVSQTAEQSYIFSEDLKALEESLPLDFTEGLAAYRQHQGSRSLKAVSQPAATGEPGWDALARQVADHVVGYLVETTGPSEAAHWRDRTDSLYADNRAMAEQLQGLVEENDQLRTALSAYELELAHYRHLMGNLYLKL
jgi:hypothetical protein